MAEPLRHSQALFGANTYTFTFWPAGIWFLSTTEPLFTTDHLHQRLVERASKSEQSALHRYTRLVAEIAAWEKRRNAERRVNWMFTTEKARDKMGRAYPKPVVNQTTFNESKPL